jgi:lipopolysaccharide transport system ATP-binding protein
MSNIAIRVDGLSKQYKIGHAKRRHDTLRDEITDGLLSFFRSNRHRSTPGFQRPSSDIIWALKDVSFEVKKGDVVGIIGRNGAGKSTLLKILSRITVPTRGYAEIQGRVGSLLEVGTGFHPELTGRENIYFNGAILGMKKTEIDRNFDQIVAFADTEKFIDTPVKHYSSGMYLRLAFAVAAHLEPEILIVDEVLAVGDAAFQRKCLGKMSDVAREGRTVFLVSHSMPAIQALCRRILWIQEGALREDADNETVISRYLASGLDAHTVDTERPEIDLSNYVRRSHSQERALQKAWVLDRNGVKNNSILMGDSLTVYYQFRCSRAIRNPVFGFALEDEYHRRILTLDNYIAANEKNVLSVAEAGIACLHIPKMPLLAGKYFITLSLVEDQHEWIDRVERALVLHVHPADVYRSGRIPEPQTQGVVFVAGEISVQSSNGLDHPALA